MTEVLCGYPPASNRLDEGTPRRRPAGGPKKRESPLSTTVAWRLVLVYVARHSPGLLASCFEGQPPCLGKKATRTPALYSTYAISKAELLSVVFNSASLPACVCSGSHLDKNAYT